MESISLETINLSDVFDVKAVQEVMDNFYKITKVGIGIIDMQGNVIVANGWQDICTKFFRSNPETCRNCIESDTVLSKVGLEGKGKFKAYKCKNHLWDLASPIFIGERHVGNIFLGQFFYDDETPDIEDFRLLARKYGFNEKEFIDALELVPRWSHEKVNQVMQFYTTFSALLSKMAFNNLQLEATLKILSKQEDCLQQGLNLLRMAGKAGRFGGWSYDLLTKTVAWSDELSTIHETESDFVPTVENGINFYAPEWRNRITEVFTRCATEGIPYDEELEIITAKGKRLWVRTLGEAVKNENGEIVKVVGSFQDITIQKQDQIKILEEQEKFRRLYENMAEGAFYQLADGTLTDINPAGLKMFGLTKDQFLGRTSYHPDWKVVDEEYNLLPPEKHPSMLALHTGQNVEMTVGVFNPVDQTYKWLSVNAIPEYKPGEDKPWQVLGTMHDITRRRMHETLNMARLHLLDFANTHKLAELLEETLNQAEKLSSSEIGFFHFLESDQKTLSLQNWSTKTKKFFCSAKGNGLHYPLSSAGVWTDCIVQRKPVIHNDYMSLSHKKGLPEGHAPLLRELVIPIFRGDLIKGVLGVGNKPSDYNKQDIEIIAKLADFAWDITELKRAQNALIESKKTTENYLNIASGIILILDKTGKIVLLNDNGQELLGCMNHGLVGKNWFETCIPDNAREQVQQVFNGLMAGKLENVASFENRVRTCSGSEKVILWHNEILYDENGNATGTISSGEDITERKRAELQILKNEARLRELNATKDKFFSIIAHDLKSPFSNILGFSSLLNDELDTLQMSEIKEFVGAINKTAIHTMQLLDNLLEWSRIQHGRILFNPIKVNLKLLVSEITEQLKENAVSKEISLINHIPEKLYCMADENMLKTIIRNLVSNAIKFTKSGGKVEVTALSTADYVEVAVADSGIGIAPESIEKLFRIDSEFSTRGTANEKGTGLGLILCREFVEKHGGNISVESKPEAGSIFRFSIPNK